MAPTELVTAAQERLPVTVVVPENHGYQVIHRLQMGRSGRSSATSSATATDRLDLSGAGRRRQAGRLEGDYLEVDLVQVAAGLGARAVRATSAAEVRDGPGRHPRPPRAGRHRRPDDPPRRPARRRRLVGRRPGRGVRVARASPRCGPSTSRGPRPPSGGSDERPPAPPRRCDRRWTTASCGPGSAAGSRRSGTFLGIGLAGDGGGLRRRRASTGCCWTWSTVPAARSRSGPSSRPPASYGVPTVVRVESAARIRLGRVLDLGAAGVMLPRLDTRRRGRARPCGTCATRRDGDRGVATYNRACRFGLDPAALDRADDEVLGVVQIESAARRRRRPRRSPRWTASTSCSSGPATSATTSASPATSRAPAYLRGARPGAGRRAPARQGLRAAGRRRRRRRRVPRARAGRFVGRRLRHHPARRGRLGTALRRRPSHD